MRNRFRSPHRIHYRAIRRRIQCETVMSHYREGSAYRLQRQVQTLGGANILQRSIFVQCTIEHSIVSQPPSHPIKRHQTPITPNPSRAHTHQVESRGWPPSIKVHQTIIRPHQNLSKSIKFDQNRSSKSIKIDQI